MSWLKWLLIAIGIAVAIVFAILAALGLLSSGSGKEVRHISIGQRTITISHYKDFTQESIADGMKVVADGHTVMVTPDVLTIDGAQQTFDPTQDVEIDIDEGGAIAAKALTPGASGGGADDDQDSGDQDSGDPSPPE